jgi:hypothetical protein
MFTVLLAFFCFQSIANAQFIPFPPVVLWENFDHSTSLYDVHSNITTLTTGKFLFLSQANGQKTDVYYYLKQAMQMWGHTFLSQYWVLPEAAVCFFILFHFHLGS